MEYKIKTTRDQEFINIIGLIREEVKKSGVQNGIAVVFIPHTTAGVTINENADPYVVFDMLSDLNKVFPEKKEHRHFEGNSHAHLKASFCGSSATVIIEDGGLKLGTWQGVYFCEFDGPRNRSVYIKVMEG